MKDHLEPNDEPLRSLLRSARPAPALPPRFQEGVWRRLERAEAPAAEAAAPFSWPEKWIDRLLWPRFAIASLALLLLAGGLTGVIANASTEKQRAQERYLSAVAPNTLR